MRPGGSCRRPALRPHRGYGRCFPRCCIMSAQAGDSSCVCSLRHCMIRPSPAFTPAHNFFTSSAQAFLPGRPPRPCPSGPFPVLPAESEEAAGCSWTDEAGGSDPAVAGSYSPDRPITTPLQSTSDVAFRKYSHAVDIQPSFSVDATIDMRAMAQKWNVLSPTRFNAVSGRRLTTASERLGLYRLVHTVGRSG